MANFEFKNSDRVVVVFKHSSYFKGLASIFVNGDNFTYLIAQDLGYKTNKNHAIKCNWAYVSSYGKDIAKQIKEFYGIDNKIEVLEVSF